MPTRGPAGAHPPPHSPPGALIFIIRPKTYKKETKCIYLLTKGALRSIKNISELDQDD